LRGPSCGLPTYKKSYQLGVLATPVQIRTDPLSSKGHIQFLSSRYHPALCAPLSVQIMSSQPSFPANAGPHGPPPLLDF